MSKEIGQRRRKGEKKKDKKERKKEMVRAPCCEMMGLKKGPWTPDEDQKLISYIQRYGHENWRALPKLAGLLRCGKSCRLRWINYLRPDIKRGNFTKEEEDTIIQLHELLGNRWSAIAAKLPGRTDNEIKNVWHTQLKKRAKENQRKLQDSVQRESIHGRKSAEEALKSQRIQVSTEPHRFYNSDGLSLESFIQSPTDQSSCSEMSTSEASPSASETNNKSSNYEKMEINMKSNTSSAESSDIEESFWLEALSFEPTTLTILDDRIMSTSPATDSSSASLCDPFPSFWPSSRKNEEVEFWLKVFMEPGEFSELPEM